MIDNNTFKTRRQALIQLLPENCVAIIAGATEQTRNNDVEFPFRQTSDFYYLTGFEEPDAFLVLCPKRSDGETILFVRPKDKNMEIWNGYRAGPEGAIQDYLADEAFEVEQIDEIVPNLMFDCRSVYASFGQNPDFDQHIMHWVNQVKSHARKGVSAPTQFNDISNLIHEMRLIKSDAEIEQLRKAAQISAQAHHIAMQQCNDGVMEYQLDAHINFHSKMNGSKREAYSSIVGSGNNACILHYVSNDQPIKNGDLVLIDAGCEYNYYAADITRTFPANGKFSKEQATLYQLVLDAQSAALAEVKPGNLYNAPHQAAVKILTHGLVDLGLLTGDVNKLVEDEAYKTYYMHNTGHWLGMDVHDAGRYKIDGKWREFKPGMVITIEPGLYVALDNEQAPIEYRGIGIRIEDDIVITETGYDVLSKDCVKEIKDVEAMCQS
ncbi:Xaa-Pro aminopeptidase [Marinicellulosiphila megalodicopiae]|uniref:Xaa-Pro aminopeptidase n=1 Tax=Marinicellulosiphila megalodicopiae TaxID=2724896 RepID=UPI003BB1CCE8